MPKRGQVTIFLIVAILTLAAVSSLFFLNQYLTTKKAQIDQTETIKLNQKADALAFQVENCIQDVSEKALITLGYYGGRDILLRPHFQAEVFDSNYLFYGNSPPPTVEEMESSLEKMVNRHLPECLPQETIIDQELVNHALLFESSIEPGDVDTTVEIEEAVLFTVRWPLTIRINDQEKTIEDFVPVKHPVRLKRMNHFLQEFGQQLRENPYFIDGFFLLQQNLTIDFTNYESDYLFLVSDENSLINYEPFRYLFAVQIPEVPT